jgi:hypothetical protein
MLKRLDAKNPEAFLKPLKIMPLRGRARFLRKRLHHESSAVYT